MAQRVTRRIVRTPASRFARIQKKVKKTQVSRRIVVRRSVLPRWNRG